LKVEEDAADEEEGATLLLLLLLLLSSSSSSSSSSSASSPAGAAKSREVDKAGRGTRLQSPAPRSKEMKSARVSASPQNETKPYAIPHTLRPPAYT
jgi:hypothetical protein